MNESAADASSQRPPVLKAKVNDVRRIASLLRPIAFAKICQVNISQAGLQVSTELSGVLQATSYIGQGMFDEFTFAPEERGNSDEEDDDDEEDLAVATFDVSLDMWLTSLNIYGTASGHFSYPGQKDAGQGGRDVDVLRKMPFARGRSVVEMTYQGRGHPLQLEIREQSVKTLCQLATYETNTVMISNMPYLPERTVGQVIMHSNELIEALMSIDPSCRNVTFSFRDGSQESEPSLSQADASAVDSARFPQTPGRRAAGLATSLSMTSQASGDRRLDGYTDTRAQMAHQVGVEMMHISAVGDTGSTEIDFPNRNKVFESFSILYPSQHTFAFANVQHCFRALQTSLKVSIRIDDQGMMSIQCLFPDRPSERQVDPVDENASPEQRGFVDIRLLPAVTDDDL